MKLTDSWYQKHPLRFALYPLSGLFGLVVLIRRHLYKLGILKNRKFSVPVVVVGNITVGGSGKTPLVIAIAELLKDHGMRPGIVSRGYGGKAKHYPIVVNADSDPHEVGDEPFLIAKRTLCPVVVDPDRARAVETLLAKNPCDVVISDDGLQHYALARDIEIVVIDGERRLGNQCCLPAGPLREPISRLAKVDLVVVNGSNTKANEYSMTLTPATPINIANPSLTWTKELSQNKIIHAIAGIGNPQRFFNTLRDLNMKVIQHRFADHYLYSKNDFNFPTDSIVIMTEKDAVKCHAFADERFWYLPVTANIDPKFSKQLLQQLSIH